MSVRQLVIEIPQITDENLVKIKFMLCIYKNWILTMEPKMIPKCLKAIICNESKLWYDAINDEMNYMALKESEILFSCLNRQH